MKKSVCEVCKTVYYSDTTIERDGKKFCTDKCLENYYLNRIESLELSLKKWKNAWFDLRDIIGWYGYTYCIPDSYKRGNEKTK